MIFLLPFLWVVLWVIVAAVVSAFSGLSPKGGGLTLFLIIFGGGGIGLPMLGGIGWYVWRRLRAR